MGYYCEVMVTAVCLSNAEEISSIPSGIVVMAYCDSDLIPWTIFRLGQSENANYTAASHSQYPLSLVRIGILISMYKHCTITLPFSTVGFLSDGLLPWSSLSLSPQ